MSIFIGGHWLWDTDGILAAYNDEGQLIDDIARLAVKYSDRVTKEATMRLIANAPDMYALLAALANNLPYSGLTRKARGDVRDFLNKIDFPCICDNDKKLIAYAPEMLKFIRQLANGYRINNWTQVCKEAEKLVKAIDEENGDNKNHE